METAAIDLSGEDSVRKNKRGVYNGVYKKNNIILDENNDLLESAVYDEEQMKMILDGIVQNVWQRMDAKGLKMTALSDLSNVPYCTLSKVFNYNQAITLKNLIKISLALHVSPIELFPYDLNRRKTNGDRFEEVTKGLDVESINYLLDLAAGFARLKLKS